MGILYSDAPGALLAFIFFTIMRMCFLHLLI